MPYIRGQWHDLEQGPVGPVYRGQQLVDDYNPVQAGIDARGLGTIHNPYDLGQNLTGPAVRPGNSWRDVGDQFMSGPVAPSIQLGTPFSGPSEKPPNAWRPRLDIPMVDTPYGPPPGPDPRPLIDPVMPGPDPKNPTVVGPVKPGPITAGPGGAAPNGQRRTRRFPTFGGTRLNTFRFK
jgi:hypothetical protein